MERRQFIAGAATAVTVSLAGCGILGGGPAGTAKEYLNALAAGNADKQDELTHDDAAAPTDSEEEFDLKINDVSKLSAEEVADELDIDEDELEDEADDTADEADADDWAYVSYDIETEDGGEQEGLMFLVKDDGWLVYSIF